MLGDERFQFRDEVAVSSAGEIGVEAVLDDSES